MALGNNFDARIVLPALGLTIRCEKMAGGVMDSTEEKKRSAATRKETARGGQGTRSNITAEAELTSELWANRALLEGACGSTPANCVKQFLDATNAPIGTADPVIGILKSVVYPDYDLEDATTANVSFEISTNE